MSGLAGFGTADQGAAYVGIDGTAISGNDRSAIQVDRTLVTATSGNVAASAAVATLGAVSGQTNVCTAVSFTYQGATAATVVSGVLSGGSDVVGGTRCFPIAVPAGASIIAQPIVIEFSPPVVAAAANATITWTVPSLGAGNTTAAATINGYRVF